MSSGSYEDRRSRSDDRFSNAGTVVQLGRSSPIGERTDISWPHRIATPSSNPESNAALDENTDPSASMPTQISNADPSQGDNHSAGSVPGPVSSDFHKTQALADRMAALNDRISLLIRRRYLIPTGGSPTSTSAGDVDEDEKEEREEIEEKATEGRSKWKRRAKSRLPVPALRGSRS